MYNENLCDFMCYWLKPDFNNLLKMHDFIYFSSKFIPKDDKIKHDVFVKLKRFNV